MTDRLPPLRIPSPLSCVRPRRRRALAASGAGLVLAASVLAAGPARGGVAAEPPGEGAGTARWMRVTEERDASIDLEIAVRSYRRPDGGPRVDLVGVAHIADGDYYERLQERLDAADLVLYEAVAPTGAVRPGGDTAEARRSSTRAALGFLAGLAARYERAAGEPAPDLEAVVAWAEATSPKLGDFAARAATDAWGGAIRLERAGEDGRPPARLRSLGADRAPGGEGEAGDLFRTVPAPPEASGPPPEGLQAELARALGLAFQLDALDYDRSHFVPSDLSLDEVNAAIAARGGDFALFEDTLAGSSLPARVVRLLLGALRTADRLLGGTVRLSVKVMLVEMLADEVAVEVGLQQMGEAFEGVIIDDRNARVIDDLERVLAEEPRLRDGSIAIFYGAGHMPDLEERLARLGFAPAGEPAWERAIRVDLAEAGVRSRELLPLRLTMRRSLQRMQEQAAGDRE